MKRSLLLVSLLLSTGPATARGESPRIGSFELGAGPYRPSIDAQAGLAEPLPYQDVFGKDRQYMFRAGISRAIFTFPGALEVGFRTGYFRNSGHGYQKDGNGNLTNIRSAETTTFNIVPTSLTLTYRFDLLADRVGIPFAPYGRVALERYNWWITGSSGAMGKKGATNGYSATAGLAFLLDFLDSGLARELDLDTGINHTYLFADVTKSWVKDFGSSTSWDLSDTKRVSFALGILFVF
ncbi:MAG TPA: MXAN_2562 family outer membrane beta-barrel protein [Anaeromyxobacter sp.]